jgi:hypothetical protein
MGPPFVADERGLQRARGAVCHGPPVKVTRARDLESGSRYIVLAMGTIMSWVRGSSGWERSPYGDLPSLRAEDTSAHQTWLILAGGIALLLSRASKAELSSRFAAARQVYAHAHGRLQKRRLPKPDPELLRDALQEIANLADPMTKEAGRECLARTVERASGKARSKYSAPSAAAGPLSSSPPTAANSSHVASTQTAAISDVEDNAATQIDLDLLFERSTKLRDAVAWRRSTTFGQES